MSTASQQPPGADDLPRRDHRADVARAAGQRAGRDTADRWAQNTLSGRAAGDVAAITRRILAGIPDGDPAALDLPALSLDVLDHAAGEAYTATTPSGPAWTELAAGPRAEAAGAYLDGYTTGLLERAGQRCRAALADIDQSARPATVAAIAVPESDDRDALAHLHPDRLRIGGIGVFAGDWAWTRDQQGHDRIPVGFVGVFIDVWNGWAVFTCTRAVAEAIVADQETRRANERADLIARGQSGPELDNAVDDFVPPMYFDGDDIIVDNSATYPQDGDAAIERISPDESGQYVVMGWSWCWIAVEPGDCDRIVGDLPTAGEQQQYVALTHVAGMRAPHDRLRVTMLRQLKTPGGVAFTAGLALDGRPVASIDNRGVGGPTVLIPAGAGFGTRQLQDYAEGCRRWGKPMTAEQVLQALVTEYDLAQRAAAADAGGDALVRAVDDDGTLHELLTLPGIPPGRGALEEIRRLVAARSPQPGTTGWEIWGGTAWHHLHRVQPSAAAPEPAASDGTAGTSH